MLRKVFSDDMLLDEDPLQRDSLVGPLDDVSSVSRQEQSDLRGKLVEYFMQGFNEVNGVISFSSKEQEEFFFENFWLLRKMKDTFDFPGEKDNRYQHTLRVLRSLHAQVLAFQDPGHAYNQYVRLAQENQGEGFLRSEQFEDICKFASNILSDKNGLAFQITLSVTHDYGVLRSGSPMHFVRSGKYCRKDFSHFFYNPEWIGLGMEIITDHAYLGSLFLGEAPLGYGSELWQKLKNVPGRHAAYGWEQLWLLSINDVNSFSGGKLSFKKYECFAKAKTTQEMFDNFKGIPYKHTEEEQLDERVRLLVNDDSFPVLGVLRGFKDVYFQYGAPLFNPADGENLLRAKGLYREAMDCIAVLWNKTRESEGQKNYRYITFQSGMYKTDPVRMYNHHVFFVAALKKFYDKDAHRFQFKGNAVDQSNMLFLGIPYEIKGKYLLIKDVDWFNAIEKSPAQKAALLAGLVN